MDNSNGKANDNLICFETMIKDLISFIYLNKYIYIYGAGKYAYGVVSFLKKIGKVPDGCCVTQKTAEKLGDVEIFEFPHIGHNLDECGFILALSEVHQEGILKRIYEFNSKIAVKKNASSFLRLIWQYVKNCEDSVVFNYPDILVWYREINRISLSPSILLRRPGGIGDVLMTEPIARELKARGYCVLLETMNRNIFEYNDSVVDYAFLWEMVPDCIKNSNMVLKFDLTYETAPLKHIVDSYIDVIRKCFPYFYIAKENRIPVYDKRLIKKDSVFIKKICVNNEASNWDSRIYERGRMKSFIIYLKKRGYEIYEIGVDEKNYLGVGKNCFGMEFHDTIKFMSEMDLYIGVDNGLMHLAQSIHLPIFVIFGCTCPTFRIHDWKRARVLWKNVDTLYCAGCYHRRGVPAGLVECDRDRLYCLDWSVEEVIDAFEKEKYDNPPKIHEDMYQPLSFVRWKRNDEEKYFC